MVIEGPQLGLYTEYEEMKEARDAPAAQGWIENGENGGLSYRAGWFGAKKMQRTGCRQWQCDSRVLAFVCSRCVLDGLFVLFVCLSISLDV